jgi:hypothetical protein
MNLYLRTMVKSMIMKTLHRAQLASVISLKKKLILISR